MPRFSLTLPTNEVIETMYATSSASGAARLYFNSERIGYRSHTFSQNYQRLIPAYQQALIDEISSSGLEFDAIVCPPSSSEHASPYLSAILKRWPVRDFSSNFSRLGASRAALDDTTLDDMFTEFVYRSDGREIGIASLIIVDDSIASGKTVAAVIQHMRQVGMPADAKVTAAVCVHMS